MAEVQESSVWVDGAKHIFDSLWNWPGAGDVGRWIILISLVLIAAALAATPLLVGLTKALEGIVKLFELYKSSGLPLPLSKADKARVRKRAQFCSVLSADLNYMAKAESWNDQYFTDLEAEVETEGGYYASAFHRSIGRRSQGLRKERSLIRAITSSAERAIQLVGEPGAGKSVALRHLASQLAVRGTRSKDKRAIVPLYVNLREMNSSEPEQVNVDSIRDFILDNIRRGDSDTSAFVRENWDEYRDTGVWFFLFDSFDEIPAVLHSEKGSAAAAAYSKAIRQFIEGMGECKGVLGSREFKGPETLPWKKFRILPLNTDKQHELVHNAFLNPEQEKIALYHLAQADSTLGTTPLFLTLLCRYVKTENKAPANDYDLLSLHIDRLARRDPVYLRRKYGLTSEELLAGAQIIARLFAEEPTLGLAPSTEQVEQMMHSSGIRGGDVGQLMSALVDCKIGRTDVPSATRGDSRFAFSHRRYQEALFVRFLVSNPGHLSADELLTDPRWREYTVTLLQTEPIANVAPILDAASHFLTSAAIQQKQVPAREPVPRGYGYFEWKGVPSTYVLELLQEGLARRMKDVPRALSLAVHRLLRPRWQSGDTFDRCEVIRLGALLPQPSLMRYLTMTFKSGTRNAEDMAFQQTTYLRGKITTTIREAVLKHLSNQILAAPNRASLIRLEALAARLPESSGADFVFQRNMNLRGIVFVLSKFIPFRSVDRAAALAPRQSIMSQLFRTRGSLHSFPVILVGVAIAESIYIAIERAAAHSVPRLQSLPPFPLLLRGDFSHIATWWYDTSVIDKWPVLWVASLMFPYFTFIVVYVLRAKGERLNLHFYSSRLTNPVVLKKYVVRFGFLVGVIGALLGASAVLGLGVKWLGKTTGLFKVEEPAALIGFALVALCGYLMATWTALAHGFSSRRFAKALETERAAICDDLVFLCNVQGIESVARSLASKKDLLATYFNNRSFASLLLSVLRGEALPNLPAVYGGRNREGLRAFRRCLQLLEDRLPNSTSETTAG